MFYAPVFFAFIIANIFAVRYFKITYQLKSVSLFLILFFVWGGNQFNGADWINYLKEFERISGFSSPLDALRDGNFEWLFSLYMWAFAIAGMNYEVFVASIALVNIFFLLRLLRLLDVRNREFILVLIFLIEGWTLYQEQLRQSIAVTLCLMATWHFMQKNKFACLIYFAVALGFHTSAIFLIPMLIISKMVDAGDGRPLKVIQILKITVILIIGSFVVGSLISLGAFEYFGLERLQGKYFEYQDSEIYGSALFNAGLIAYGIGFLIILQCRNYVVAQNNSWSSFAWSCALLWCVLGPALRTFSILIRFEHYLLMLFPFIVAVYGKQSVKISSTHLVHLTSFLFAMTFLVRIFASPAHDVWVQRYNNLFVSFLIDRPLEAPEARRNDVCFNLKTQGNSFCD